MRGSITIRVSGRIKLSGLTGSPISEVPPSDILLALEFFASRTDVGDYVCDMAEH